MSEELLGSNRNQEPERELQPKPRCRVPRTSHQRCWITSWTIYMTRGTRSGVVAWSPNRGSRVVGSIFSPISYSIPRRVCNRGRRRFQILPPLLHITPQACSSTVTVQSRLRIQKRLDGSEVFLTSSTCGSWIAVDRSPAGLQSLSSHSTDCLPSSNPSAWLSSPFRPCNFSTSSFHSLFSRT